MNKKLLIGLVCLLIVIVAAVVIILQKDTTPTAPEVSVEPVITVSFVPGEDLSAIPGLADLLNTLAFQFRTSEELEAFGFSLLANNESAFDSSFRSSENGLYVYADKLYEKPMYFSYETLTKLVEESMASSGVDSATFEQFQQSLTMSNLSQASKNQEITSVSPEEAKKQLQDPEFRKTLIEATGGDETFLDFMEALYDKMVMTEGEFISDDHDTADAKVELTIDNGDILAMMDTTYMKQQLQSQLVNSHGSLSAEELEEQTEELLQAAKDELKNATINMPMVMFYHGIELVAADFDMDMQISDTDAGTGNINYRRLTTAGDAKHSFSMTMSTMEAHAAPEAASADAEAPEATDADAEVPEVAAVATPNVVELTGVVNVYANGNYDMDVFFLVNNEAAFTAKGVWNDAEGNVDALLSLLPAGEEEVIFQFTSVKTENGCDNQVALYMKNDGSDPMVLTEADKPLFAVKVNIANIDSDSYFDTVQAATSETAVDVLSLEGDDMTTFSTDLITNMQTFAQDFLTKLPESAMQLFGLAVGSFM